MVLWEVMLLSSLVGELVMMARVTGYVDNFSTKITFRFNLLRSCTSLCYRFLLISGIEAGVRYVFIKIISTVND